MKPLIRWTLGPCDDLGLEILEECLFKIIKIYSFCDLVICYNNISNIKFKKFKKFKKLELIDQTKYVNQLPISPINEIWKLCPPRLNIKTHEIILDNDLLIIKKIPHINNFFKYRNKNLLLLATSGKRFYGQFDDYVPNNTFINSGLFGMHPNFDFQKKIFELCKNKFLWKQNRKDGLFDDQGLVAASLIDDKTIFIPPTEILNCDPSYTNNVVPCKGYHFIEANRGNKKIWNEYISCGFRKLY